ncbi:TPA: hypothetical protein O7U53_004376 [Salmonella enterica]|nr:hypothetical protein [Salmonella enterica]
MASLRDTGKKQNAQWPDYVGSILRGTQTINRPVPQHPYLNDIPILDEMMRQNTHHVVLLTLNDAKNILNAIKNFDYINFFTTHASGIKDTFAWLKTGKNLMTDFDETGKLVFGFRSLLHTKARYIEMLGVKYIRIITSNTWLIDKLGKYIFNSRAPQILELALGWRGAVSEAIKGIKFCIWFSVGWRLIQFFMSSEHNIINLLTDIAMDTTKALIVGGMAAVVGSLVSLVCLSLGWPVVLVTGAIIATGIIGTVLMNTIDDHLYLSEKLKVAIKDGLKKQQEINEHKMKNLSPFMYVLTSTPTMGIE